MITANGSQISIAAEYGHHKFRFGKFQSEGERQRSAVGGVVGIKIHVASHPTGAPDSRNNNVPLDRNLRGQDGCGVAAHDHPNPTTRAPDVRHSASANDVI